jgi:prepilin-type N-terminal cleavage/methylation domain-containing protein
MKKIKNNLGSGFTLIEVIITLVVVAVVAAMMVAYFGTSITQSSLPIARLKATGKLNQIMEKITAEYNNNPATWSPGTPYTVGANTPTVILPTATNRNGYQYVCTTGGTSGTAEPVWNNAMVSGATLPSDGTVTWTYGGFTPSTNWLASTAYPSKAVVYPKNGYQYICNTAGGISGTTEPTWPTSGSVIETTGSGITWTFAGLQPTMALQAKIAASAANGGEGLDRTQTFGGQTISYHVIQNRFITFDTSNTENDTCTSGSCNMLIYGVNTNVYGKYLKVTIGLHSTESPRTDDTLTTLFVRR